MKSLSATLLAFCIGLSAPSLFSTPALADDEAVVEMARQRFKEGVAFFDKKQYDKARVAFLQAYALKAHPAVLLNLAQSELRSDHEVEAAQHFSQYLREHGDATAEQRQAAQEGLAQAKQSVGELKLSADAVGATVRLDGEEVGATPLPDPIYMSPGSHTVSVAKGDNSSEFTVELGAGDTKSESVSLEKTKPSTPAATPPADGGDAQDDAEADDDQGSKGGSESYSASSEGFIGWFVDTPAAWVGGGVAVLGAGLGGVLAYSSKDNFDSADSYSEQIEAAAAEDSIPTRGVCDPSPGDPVLALPEQRRLQYYNACKDYTAKVDKGEDRKKQAIASFAVAGVATAAVIVYYFVDTAGGSDAASDETPRPRGFKAMVAPQFAPGYSGLSLVGEF